LPREWLIWWKAAIRLGTKLRQEKGKRASQIRSEERETTNGGKAAERPTRLAAKSTGFTGIGRDRKMSLTVNRSSINNLRRIKGAYIASACSFALAVSVVIAATPWQQDLSGSAGSGAGSALFQASQQPDPPEFTYFLVGSQAEAARLEAFLSAESHTLAQIGQPLPRFQVMVVDTTEREHLVAEANRELTQAGSAVKFVDWRR
jgi:hypothetical protein